MSENFNSHIACEGTDNDINWVCKVCKDLPNYAGMYLYQREREKNQLKNVKDRCADLILMKYYYALLTCWTRYMSFMNVLIRKMMYQNTQTGNAQHQNVLFIIDIYIILMRAF